MQKASFFQDLMFGDSKPAVQMLLQTPFSRELRIVFRKDQLMKQHQAPAPIMVEVMDGEIMFGVGGEKLALNRGDLIALDANVPHDLLALTDSVVRLSLALSDSVSRVKEAAQ